MQIVSHIPDDLWERLLVEQIVHPDEIGFVGIVRGASRRDKRRAASR